MVKIKRTPNRARNTPKDSYGSKTRKRTVKSLKKSTMVPGVHKYPGMFHKRVQRSK
jgi:hypothetical protein